MKFYILSIFLFLLKCPVILFGQISDSIDITSYIQNAIFTEQYDQLQEFSTPDWYEANYELEKSRDIHTFSMLSNVLDTIQFPENPHPKRFYQRYVIPSEYETYQENGKRTLRRIRIGRVTRWNEWICAGENSVFWDQQLIKEIQQKLKENKWYNGMVDGVLNKQTILGFHFYLALKLNFKDSMGCTITYPNERVHKSLMYKFLGHKKYAPWEGVTYLTQKALLEKGYYKGELNNIFDQKTKDALTKFQRDHDLKVGALDSKTIEKLGVW